MSSAAMRTESAGSTTSAERGTSSTTLSGALSLRLFGDVGSSVLRRFAGGSVGRSRSATDGTEGRAKEKPKSAVIARTLL